MVGFPQIFEHLFDVIEYFSPQNLPFFRLKAPKSSFHELRFIPTSLGTFLGLLIVTLKITTMGVEIRFDTQMRCNVEIQGFVFILQHIDRKNNSSGTARGVGRIFSRRGVHFEARRGYILEKVIIFYSKIKYIWALFRSRRGGGSKFPPQARRGGSICNKYLSMGALIDSLNIRGDFAGDGTARIRKTSCRI